MDQNGPDALINKPVFLIGCPRSGTTLVSRTLAPHEDLAWFSNLMNRFPKIPHSAIFSRLAAWPTLSIHLPGTGKYIPRLEEAWRLWERCCGVAFRREWLINTTPSRDEELKLKQLVRLTVRLQGKKRFLAKLTGPPRITYLRQIFPEAYFVHIIRDGRAVVNSLLEVDFWRERGGLEKPWWEGLPSDGIKEWEQHGKTAAALAAVQWKHIIELAREENKLLASSQYLEVRYEDFVVNPQASLDRILEFCHLRASAAVQAYVTKRLSARNMNFKWQGRFTEQDLKALDDIMGNTLRNLGYR